MTITYFHNQVVTLTYEPEWKLGTATIQGFLSSEEFREAMMRCGQLMAEMKPLRWLADNRKMKVIRLMAEMKPLRWLADNRKMKVIRQADQEWFMAHALPKLQASTICRNATVVSADIFNQMAVEKIVRQADSLGNMLLQAFSDKPQALAWLKQPIVATDKP